MNAGPGRRGEFAFTVGGREIGHLHGDRAAHFFFGRELGMKLKREGRVVDHPIFPGKPGPAARRIETEADVGEVIELLRLNYDRLRARGRRARATDHRAAPAADPVQDGQPSG